MPSLLDLRRRIRSVKNTQQITRAMKIVSAARLRRAQDRVTASRPYSKGFGEVLEQIADSVRGAEADGFQHPLLEQREESRILVFVITSDRGLCGAYNANLIKNARRFIDEKVQAGISVDLHTVGRKGDEFFRKRNYSIREAHIQFLAQMTYLQVEEMARQLARFYTEGEYDAVYLLYTEFRSAASQFSTQKKLLPVSLPEDGEPPEFLFDQPAEALLASMLNQYVVLSLYQSLLEANASEHGARMSAMDSATRNANEMIMKLTMRLNRVRQASITTELIEVVSGAQALD